MIRLNGVNKYFNKFKKNQIHVINNTTLEFPSSGLIALLGPSGCGKTTLLNVIGGLDKVNSGNIYINGEKITKRRSGKVDEIRNLNVGYIFQDYKLVENMTVFENVALSLRILGIKDKEEITNRVLYTLEKVNMLRYKNRPVSMLSGGERQRVGIARALVKNPKIIIADEPTGNLDSKNSLEVMNIIKSLSTKYLVVLVTHEVDLAKFYADRVIELQDGVVVKDYENNYQGSLNYKLENRFYLKDFKTHDKISKDNLNIDIYREHKDDELNIKVVFKNGNIYIENSTNEKIEVVDNNSNIELVDDHYKEIKDIEVSIDTFDISKVSSNKYKEKYSSIFNLWSFITYGFKKILDYPMLKKVLLAGFFLSGIFIFYSVSSIFASINIEDKDFILMNKNYLTASVRNISVDDYLNYEKNSDINYILPSNSIINLRIKYDKFLQTTYNSGQIMGSLSSTNMLNSNDLIIGRMPMNDNEIVVDKMVLDKTINEYEGYQAGFSKLEDFLNHEVYMDNISGLKIVGITNVEVPNIYTDEKLFINLIANTSFDEYDTDSTNGITDYKLLIDKGVKLVKGNLPVNDYEILVNIDREYEFPLNKEIDSKINNKKLKVVGYYKITSNEYFDAYLGNNNMVKYELISKAKNLSIYGNDKDSVLDYFYEKNINIKDSYQYSKDIYIEGISESIKNTLIVSGVILLISLIEILLMIRSSFLSRIKEVGIYRAIGVKKSDIYKMFAGEILAITFIASFPGIIFMTYVLFNLSKISYLKNMFMVNPFVLVLSLILVLLFNLVVGLIPVFNTIRKTPAEILSRFDVD